MKINYQNSSWNKYVGQKNNPPKYIYLDSLKTFYMNKSCTMQIIYNWILAETQGWNLITEQSEINKYGNINVINIHSTEFIGKNIDR